MAQKQTVSDNSSGSASGSITYPLPSSAVQQKGRKKPSKKGRPGDDGGPPLPPQRGELGWEQEEKRNTC